jgi:hypothetical protein
MLQCWLHFKEHAPTAGRVVKPDVQLPSVGHGPFSADESSPRVAGMGVVFSGMLRSAVPLNCAANRCTSVFRLW